MEQGYLTNRDNPGPSGPRMDNGFNEQYIIRHEADA